MTSPPASTAGSPASAPATAPPSSRSDFHTPFSLSSSSSKHVMLHRWWLIKSDTDYAGKRLAIGGLNDHGNSMRRVFTSVPIVKRLDGWTLETADGFTVQIMGFIDQKRTRDNGILLEVSHKFRVGFPYNWEEYADGDFGETPTSPIQPLRCSGIDEQSENLHGEISKILDGLKALRRQDHVRKSGVDNAGGSEGEIGRKYSKESYANSMIEEEPNYSKDGSIAGITDIDGLSIPSNGHFHFIVKRVGLNPIFSQMSILTEQVDDRQKLIKRNVLVVFVCNLVIIELIVNWLRSVELPEVLE